MTERLLPGKENLSKHPKILLVSTKLDPHVDMIANKLNQRNIPFVRFNTEDFPLRVSATIGFENHKSTQELKFPYGRSINGDEISGVWYRRPAQFKFPPEFTPVIQLFAEEESRSTIRGLWEILDCVWINHPQRNREAELKIKQLKTANEVGLEIPRTLITNNPEDAEKFFRRTESEGVIIKRLSGGIMLDGDQGSAIYTSIVKAKDMEHIERVKYAPALFQEYVEKDLELRITVVGDKVFPVEIHSQKSDKAKIDWRKDTLNLKHKEHQLPPDVTRKILNFNQKLGLNFGAIDMILTPDGKYVFLEINPNGQWGWVEDLTGLPISEEIIHLLMKTPRP